MHEDTRKLLQDDAAGLEMAITSLEELLPAVNDPGLRGKIRSGLEVHRQFREQTLSRLRACGSEPRSLGPVALTMAWLKTNGRMALQPQDPTAALVIAKGCDMGVRGLSRSRNRYGSADPAALALNQSIIDYETKFSAQMRSYL